MDSCFTTSRLVRTQLQGTSSSVTISRFTSTVKDILLEKHPSPRIPEPSVLLSLSDFSAPPLHPSLLDNLDGTLVFRTIVHMDSAAGPSELDAVSWKKLYTAFKEASDTLYDSLSAVARSLVITLVDPAVLSAFDAYHLITLDNHPGVRPIGVCRRLLFRVFYV